MPTLEDIYLTLNLKDVEQKIHYTQIFACCDGFNSPTHYLSEEKETGSLCYQRRAKLVAQAFPIWNQTHLKKYYEGHKGKIISREEALELMKTKLSSSFVLDFIWFSNMVDVYFLRKEFEGEGIESDINENRWKLKEELDVSLLEDTKENGTTYQLFQCAKSLHLIDESPWPKDQIFYYIILQGSVEKYVIDRVKFLHKNLTQLKGKFTEKIKLYHCSGPRGASSCEDEKYTSLVLADMFQMPNKVNIIRNFLKKHQAKEDPLQWNKDLSGLKKGLVAELDAKEWPKAPKSYYYYPGHKKIYDEVTLQAGQQSLDCEGGPWPVPADLVKKMLEEQFKDDLDFLKEIDLIPVVAMGKQGRLTTMEDTLEKWLTQEGKIPVAEGNPILIIACNTMHFLPFANYSLTHTPLLQDAITRSNLQNKLTQFNEEKEVKTTSGLPIQSTQWKVIGPAARFFSKFFMFDQLAKSLFAVRKIYKEYSIIINMLRKTFLKAKRQLG